MLWWRGDLAKQVAELYELQWIFLWIRKLALTKTDPERFEFYELEDEKKKKVIMFAITSLDSFSL